NLVGVCLDGYVVEKQQRSVAVIGDGANPRRCPIDIHREGGEADVASAIEQYIGLQRVGSGERPLAGSRDVILFPLRKGNSLAAAGAVRLVFPVRSADAIGALFPADVDLSRVVHATRRRL